MNVDELLHSEHIKLVIQLKTRQLQREQLSSLQIDNVEKTLVNYVWKMKMPVSINEAIDDVLHLTVGEIVAYLSNEAVVKGSQMNLEDFKDMMKVTD